MNEKPLLALFDQYGLSYELHQHEAIFTSEEGERVCAQIKGLHGKNLFLRDEKRNFFLLSTLPHKRVDLKALSKQLATSRFSFANAELLLEKLGVIPGSVTPYGLIHSGSAGIKFFLDKDILQHEVVNFHPLRNDMTISMKLKPFLAFFDHIKHPPTLVQVPVMGGEST